MISILTSTFLFTGLLQGHPALGEPSILDIDPNETVDERVAREAAAITVAMQTFVEEKRNKLKPYLSKDTRIKVYSDFSAKESKAAFKRIEAMFEHLDRALGVPGEAPEPLFAFMIRDQGTYARLCDAIAEAGPSQAESMSMFKESTGFTLFAPEVTTYFHDVRVQKEARVDHSIAHNLVHLELHRRYGVLPLWVREALATAAEDMAFGEVWAPWNLHGFVFAASHADWRGRDTRELVKDLQGLDGLFQYSANPYQDDLAHIGFAFGVYSMLEDPESLQGFLAAMQERYAATNEDGGRPAFTMAMYQEMFQAHYAEGFLERMQKWWKKPPRWNAKPKKKRKN